MNTWIIWIVFTAMSFEWDALKIYHNGIEKKGNLKHGYRMALRFLFGLVLVNRGRDVVYDVSYFYDLFLEAVPFYAFFWLVFDPWLTLRRMHYIEDFRPADGIFYAGKDWWELSFLPWHVRTLFKAGLFITSILVL